MKPALILASASPRRHELLRLARISFEVQVADVDETQLAGETAEGMVLRLAEEKARVVAERNPEKFVLAADTTVVLPGDKEKRSAEVVLGKPESVEDARRMLGLIQGREHFVFTGVWLVCVQRGVSEGFVVKTGVTMRGLSSEEIADYVATGEPMDKAGAYAAQGVGAMLIESFAGSYTNVVGLPLSEVVLALKRHGVL